MITLVYPALLTLTAAELVFARGFVFDKWCERALERGEKAPLDLSRACKYSSLFMRTVFGGTITGNYQHQFNIIDGNRIDINDRAADVLALARPHFEEPELFDVAEHIASMRACQPRVDVWVAEYMQYMLLDRAQPQTWPTGSST